MKSFNRRTAPLLAALLLASVSALRAGDAILLRKTGDVEIRLKGMKSFRKVAAGADLVFGDTLQTRKGAKAQVLFSGGAVVLIKESSTMRLSGNSKAIQVNIPKGEFLIGLKQRLARGTSFRVRTPAAVASIRGTLFWGLSDDELNSTYASFHNSISIQAKGKEVILNPGEKTFIPYGKAPQKVVPANVPLDFVDTFQVDGTIEGLKDIVQPGK